MNGLPYFAFYANDFVGGVKLFTTEEVGAYMLLLCYQWTNGPLPKDQADLERIACATVSQRVRNKFQDTEHGLVNHRLEVERVRGITKKKNAMERLHRHRKSKKSETRCNGVAKPVAQRLCSDSDSILPLGSRDIQEPVKAKAPTRKPIQVESMPVGLESLLADFNAYLSQRGTGGKKATPRSVELDLKHMAAWGLEKARFILEKAVASNYQGLNDYGEFDKLKGLQGASPQPGGMNAQRTFNKSAHDALMDQRAIAIGLDPYALD